MAARSASKTIQASKGTLGAGSGMSVVVDVPIPTDRGVHLRAEVTGGKLDGTSHLLNALYLVAEGTCKNNNGTITFPSGISTSQNPKSASNMAGAETLISDIGAEATLAWSVSSTNARLILSSGGAGSVGCDVDIVIYITTFGSV